MTRFCKITGLVLNTALVLWLVLVCLYLAAVLTLQSGFAAAVTLVLLVLILRRQRWGYFAAAAWGLACYQLAKEGLMFADVKSLAMVGGMAAVVVSIILHEIFYRKPASAAS